jgi:hypothetical protein
VRRFVLPALATAAVVFACSPRSHSAPAAARRAKPSGALLAHVDVQVTQGVQFDLAVANDTDKRVELDFTDGRTHDFAVLDASGREVWRWSRGRLFTQAMQNRLLEASDTAHWREQWDPPAGSGRYTVVAMLHAANHPVEQRVDFWVP